MASYYRPCTTPRVSRGRAARWRYDAVTGPFWPGSRIGLNAKKVFSPHPRLALPILPALSGVWEPGLPGLPSRLPPPVIVSLCYPHPLRVAGTIETL